MNEEPELIQDQNVKILKQTKNEILAEVVAKLSSKPQEQKKTDSDSEDSFERSSNDDLTAEFGVGS